MIRNSKGPVVSLMEGKTSRLQVEIPSKVAEKAGLYEDFEITYVVGLDAIRKILAEGSDKATYDPHTGMVNGAILLVF